MGLSEPIFAGKPERRFLFRYLLMTAGLQIFGQHGVVQIDDNYQNLGVSASGAVTLTLDPAPHPNHMQIGTITVTGETPILAFAASESPINVERVVISGSTHTFQTVHLCGERP